MADLDSLSAIKKDQTKQANDAAAAFKKDPPKRAELHVAVNLVRHIGEDGKPTDVEAGTPFYPSNDDVDFLLKHFAIRPATPAERALYERQNPTPAADESLG